MQARLGGENRGPLKDLRVVEMGTLIAGPFCGRLMGDMGAEVRSRSSRRARAIRCGSGGAASTSGGR
jgi:crotonobetainyl-CoA:carnitine CoA-transferase CaiB-like acyl-CoA transferase